MVIPTEIKGLLETYSLRYPRIRISIGSFGVGEQGQILWQVLLSIPGTEFRAIGTAEEPLSAFAIASAEMGMNTEAW